VIVTSRSSSREYDFVSRLFAPSIGIPEDPVTGSSHCSLAPFWSERLGKSEMVGFQASKRSGSVRVTVAGDRVLIAGAAVTVMRGELLH
jgi:predicted PhzF superfamily epimerase YddE/YHI9